MYRTTTGSMNRMNQLRYSQPTGPGCQRKTPWSVHTNDPVNLGSGPEFWLQFANAVEFWNKHGDDFLIVHFTVVLAELQVLR